MTNRPKKIGKKLAWSEAFVVVSESDLLDLLADVFELEHEAIDGGARELVLALRLVLAQLDLSGLLVLAVYANVRIGRRVRVPLVARVHRYLIWNDCFLPILIQKCNKYIILVF